MAFSILLNISIGIILAAMPTTFIGHTSGIGYDSSKGDAFNNLSGSVTPDGTLQASSSLADRVLDLLSVGLVGKIVGVVDKYLYGWINLLKSIFQPFLGLDLSNTIFPILKGALTLAYIMGLISIWTGRDFDK